jgi:hypothetical protein
MFCVTEKIIDARARRAAARCGLRAIKSRTINAHYNDEGQYMLVDERGLVAYGARSELSAEDVIEICSPE